MTYAYLFLAAIIIGLILYLINASNQPNNRFPRDFHNYDNEFGDEDSFDEDDEDEDNKDDDEEHK